MRQMLRVLAVERNGAWLSDVFGHTGVPEGGSRGGIGVGCDGSVFRRDCTAPSTPWLPVTAPTLHVGTVIRTTNAVALRAICASGLDWLMLDGEHASVGMPEIESMLHTVDGRLRCYARVRTLDGVLVNHALENGAEGVVFPNIDTVVLAEAAVHLVRDSRWPKARVVVQAESAEAVRNIEQIVRVPGIHWVLIGPNDLTASLGIPGQFEAPEYLDAVAALERACRGANVPVGIFGMTPEMVAPYEDRGFEWLLVGIDRPA